MCVLIKHLTRSSKYLGTENDWHLVTESSKGMNNRQIQARRGKYTTRVEAVDVTVLYVSEARNKIMTIGTWVQIGVAMRCGSAWLS